MTLLCLILSIENEVDQDIAHKIFNDNIERMVALANRILNNREDAEDAAMEAMRYICQNIEMFSDYQSSATIHLIELRTKHAAIDIYRRNKKQSERLTTLDAYDNACYADTGNPIEQIAISDMNKKLLLDAIDMLDDMYRIPITLKYLYNMRNQDIADYLNIDVGTVTGRIFRGKRMLEEALNKMGYER